MTNIEGFKFGNGLARNIDRIRGRVGNTDRLVAYPLGRASQLSRSLKMVSEDVFTTNYS